MKFNFTGMPSKIFKLLTAFTYLVQRLGNKIYVELIILKNYINIFQGNFTEIFPLNLHSTEISPGKVWESSNNIRDTCFVKVNSHIKIGN